MMNKKTTYKAKGGKTGSRKGKGPKLIKDPKILAKMSNSEIANMLAHHFGAEGIGAKKKGGSVASRPVPKALVDSIEKEIKKMERELRKEGFDEIEIQRYRNDFFTNKKSPKKKTRTAKAGGMTGMQKQPMPKPKPRKKPKKPRGTIGKQYDTMMGKPMTAKTGGRVSSKGTGHKNRLY